MVCARYQARIASRRSRYDFVAPVVSIVSMPDSSQRVTPCAVAWPPIHWLGSRSATRTFASAAAASAAATPPKLAPTMTTS